jgi:hypothetical protein
MEPLEQRRTRCINNIKAAPAESVFKQELGVVTFEIVELQLEDSPEAARVRQTKPGSDCWGVFVIAGFVGIFTDIAGVGYAQQHKEYAEYNTLFNFFVAWFVAWWCWFVVLSPLACWCACSGPTPDHLQAVKAMESRRETLLRLVEAENSLRINSPASA